MGALGRSLSVGSSTDSPPTPESKKRMGASGSIGSSLREAKRRSNPVRDLDYFASLAMTAHCTGKAFCYQPRNDPRDALCPGARLPARVDPVRAGADPDR